MIFMSIDAFRSKISVECIMDMDCSSSLRVSEAVPRVTGNICFTHVIIEENPMTIKVFQNGKKLSSKNHVCVSGLSENVRPSQSTAYLSQQKQCTCFSLKSVCSFQKLNTALAFFQVIKIIQKTFSS